MKIPTLSTIYYLLSTILLSSCIATREDVAGIEVQVARLEKNMGSLEKKQAELAQRLDEIKRPVENLNSNLNDTQNLLNNFNPKFEELRSLVEALRKDMAERVSGVTKKLTDVEQNLQTRLAARKNSGSSPKTAGPKANGSPAGAASAGAPDSAADAPLKLFQGAYKDYLAQRWDLADSGFAGYLKNYPQGSMADKSLYYRALSLKQKKMASDAHESLDQLTARFPKSNVARAGMLEKAKLYLDESKTTEAEGMLEYLVMTHPKTKEAEEAKELLKKIPHK
ncbi:MAG: outer membrane protein assembly factor BamD [Elusimicrobia bacterium]|nr:outer membrane protein assembly factor BamD [Elusimicrobiota bacterium]